MGARVIVTTGSGQHKPAQQTRFTLNLGGASDDIRRIVVCDAIVSDREDIQLYAVALCLNDFPALEDPYEVDAVRFQRLHRVNAQGHISKLAFAPVLLDDLAHDG